MKKMRQKHCLTWNMVRNTENGRKWEMHTVGTGIWQENWKTCKMRHKHCINWNMSRNTDNGRKWEMHNVDVEYGKKTEKYGKWETHTL